MFRELVSLNRLLKQIYVHSKNKNYLYLTTTVYYFKILSSDLDHNYYYIYCIAGSNIMKSISRSLILLYLFKIRDKYIIFISLIL